jgi:hypothetical protein
MESNHQLWKKLYEVNQTCPKFIVTNPHTFGFGDMMARLMLAITAAYTVCFTLVFDHQF